MASRESRQSIELNTDNLDQLDHGLSNADDFFRSSRPLLAKNVPVNSDGERGHAWMHTGAREVHAAIDAALQNKVGKIAVNGAEDV